MSEFRVILDNEPAQSVRSAPQPPFESVSQRNGRKGKVLGIMVAVAACVAAIGGLTAWLYYQSLKDEPQYALALLVDAAKRDDQQTINEIIDIDAVVDDFMPQIVKKAVEMYGRGVPQPVIDKMSRLADPLMPAIKDRARTQLAKVIRDRTERYGRVPFFMMVIGAGRYLDINAAGDTAIVRSRSSERLELKMSKVGGKWKVVGLNDDQLATDIARTVGQQLIEFATRGLTKKAAETFGVGNLADLLRQAEELVR
ncbi:MAG: hypothetical protein IPM59_08585 [Chloracidobacterium sp.]|nr:hypothetical protein [Chloracidobacterium sp.]